jgi:DNA-binding NarL/FixJ family response regulator
MVLKGLVATLSAEPDIEVVGSTNSGPDALEQFALLKPDVTLMDVTLGAEMNGIEAIRLIRTGSAEARIVVVSASSGDEVIYQALQAGAVTYLLKERLGDDLVPIVREVHEGKGRIPSEVARKLADRVSRTALTAREVEVLRLIAEGLRNKEIAAELQITDQTVEFHIKNIFLKLGVHDRTKAVTVAIRRGIIRVAP